ncbi:outer membrane protein assembly factor BamA [Pararhizobium sp. BT-229]|uniref:outer membrane protein assembly factor BamA n=1 Tax=Pararhizobium sp. BT-229 TaxID=2986923 RepID=UPI0021F6CA98|nr:outer membrane protein assembly factor BamA [Pararhizobium sp. BT-229]MCV9964208.1 outer membrane protein assembly factor BamA [Pararhizobium sp. BT-229]
MKSKSLLAAASLLAISASFAHARPEIEVVGNGKVDAEFIASVFPDKKAFGEADTDKAVKDLFATGAFTDVKVEKRGSKVVVTVSETPVVVNVVFNGNKRLKDEQLLVAGALDSGTAFDPARLPEVSARIAAAYAATGRHAAKVTSSVFTRDGGFYDVSFAIDEGDRSETSEIWFEGNRSFSASKLRSVMVTKPTGLLSKLFSRDVLDEGRMEADRRRIEAYYRSKGFADVIVSEPEIDFDPEGKKGMAGFRITEGPRYTVGSVSVDNTVSAPFFRLDEVKKMEGQTYDPAKAARGADLIGSNLDYVGPMDIQTRTSRLPNGTMNIEYVINRGQKVYVERIEIVGNQVTKDYVVRREFDLSEGDLFDPRLVREAERRLNRLGFFDSVRIATAKGSSEDRVVVRVEVVERKTGEFSIGGAYSTADGPMAVISLSQANFGGTGRAFSASVGQGTETGNYDFSFTEPYIFGNRLSATMQVFRRDYDNREGGFRPYDETVDGAKITLKGPISANTDLGVYYSLSTSKKSDIDADVANTLVSGDDHVVSSLGYDWGYADLDDEKNPTNGLKTSFGQQFAGLGGDSRFVKSEASARLYRELSERHEIVGSLAVRAGHVAALGDDLDFSDHFRTAGELVRGFENGGIGPRDATTGYLLGGQYYAGASAEAIYPIPVLSDGLGIKGSIFADLGTVWGVDGDTASSTGAKAMYDSASIRSSVGTGVVWDSPLGLFKANFALPLSKEDGDRTQVFSISGGTRF